MANRAEDEAVTLIGGADGPTAVLVSGESPVPMIVGGGVFAVILLAAAAAVIKRKKSGARNTFGKK